MANEFQTAIDSIVSDFAATRKKNKKQGSPEGRQIDRRKSASDPFGVFLQENGLRLKELQRE